MAARAGRVKRRALAAAVAGWCAAGLLPAAADAAVRFAAPGGVTAGSCPMSNPCALEFAVETAAQPGDEVVVAAGTYPMGTGSLAIGDVGLDLHGQAGQPRPLITSSATFSGVEVPVAATVRHLRIAYSGGTYALNLDPSSGTAQAEGVVVEGGGLGACHLGNAALRDSICRSTAHGTDALVMAGSGPSNDASATATNVTALGGALFTGSGTHAVFVNAQNGASLLLQGKNVIARGVDDDVRLTSQSGSTAAAILINSSFAEATGAGSGLEIVPVPGAGGNQTAAPLLVDPNAGDYHQSPGSPTINAGTGGPGLGAADLDGEARTQGAAPDIGADEFTESPPPAGAPPPGAVSPAEPPAAGPDRDPPIISGASLSRRRFRLRTRVRFTLSEPATTILALERRKLGRRVRRRGRMRCVKPSSKLRRGRTCIRHTRVRAWTHSSSAGRTSLPLRRGKLPAGRYRLRLTAVDSAGNRAKTNSLRLTILTRAGRAAAHVP